jgi:hypothetical protein
MPGPDVTPCRPGRPLGKLSHIVVGRLQPLPSALATRLRQLDPKWCVILLNGLTVSSWRHRHAAPAAVDQARAKRPVASGSDRQIQSLER